MENISKGGGISWKNLLEMKKQVTKYLEESGDYSKKQIEAYEHFMEKRKSKGITEKGTV